MKIITFRTKPNGYYGCSEPYDQSGEYVRLKDHAAEVERLNKEYAELVSQVVELERTIAYLQSK